MKAYNQSHLKNVFVKKLLAAEAILRSWKFQGLHLIQRKKSNQALHLQKYSW